MGLDAIIWFTGPVGEGLDRKELRADMIDAFDFADNEWFDVTYEQGYPKNVLVGGLEGENEYRYEGIPEFPQDRHVYSIGVGYRFYDEHYERGPWPAIYSILRFLMERTKAWGGKVYYGNDCSDIICQATEESLNETWRHFSLYGHQPYREKRGIK